MKIRNWRRHQHFKFRKPPWIKLYRDLLQDPDFHKLSGDQTRLLIMLWLVGSEQNGQILDNIQKLSFKIRVPEEYILAHLPALMGTWIVPNDFNELEDNSKEIDKVDIMLTSSGHQVDDKVIHQSTEYRVTEIQTDLSKSTPSGKPSDKASGKKKPVRKPDGYSDEFMAWYSSYPRKEGKHPAFKAWCKNKNRPPLEHLLKTLEWQKRTEAWTKDGGQFVPLPGTYINNQRWDDENPEEKKAVKAYVAPRCRDCGIRVAGPSGLCLVCESEKVNRDFDVRGKEVFDQEKIAGPDETKTVLDQIMKSLQIADAAKATITDGEGNAEKP